MKSRSFLFAYLNLITAALLWGLQGTLSSLLLRAGFDSLSVASVRPPVAVIVVGLSFLLGRNRLTKLRLTDAILFFFMGSVGIFGNTFVCVKAMSYLGVPLTITIAYLSPVFVLLFSALLFHERITLDKIAATAVILFGCVVASGLLTSAQSVSWIGVFFALAGALSYAFYSLCLRQALKRFSSQESTFYAVAGATPIAVVCLFMSPMPSEVSFPVGALLLIQAVLSALPYIVYGRGMRVCGSSVSSIFATLELPFSAIISRIVLHEAIPGNKLLGITLVTLASVYIGLSGLRKQKKLAAPKSTGE